MPRGYVKLRRETILQLGSQMSIEKTCGGRVRPTTALEKYEEGCGSVTHITGEPLKMFIGTRAPSSSVSRT